jgi:hypothetical protein
MSLKRWLGIDGFDFLVQGVLTVCAIAILGPGLRFHADFVVPGVLGTSLAVLAWRRQMAKNRGELGSTSGSFQVSTAELDDRLAEIDSLHQRLGELEERVDFAERMLSRERQLDRLPEGK